MNGALAVRKENEEARQLVAASGRTQAEVAAFLKQRTGRNIEYWHVSRMTKGARAVKSDEMDALRELVANSDTAPSQAAKVPGPISFAPTATTHELAEIPLYAAGGAPGARLRLDDDHRVAFVPRHPAQIGARHPFAFICVGEHVAQRLMHGEIGFACRMRPAVKGQLCVIEMSDGTCVVAFYAGEDEKTLRATQTNPQKALTFAVRDVAGVHAVVGATFAPGY